MAHLLHVCALASAMQMYMYSHTSNRLTMLAVGIHSIQQYLLFEVNVNIHTDGKLYAMFGQSREFGSWTSPVFATAPDKRCSIFLDCMHDTCIKYTPTETE